MRESAISLTACRGHRRPVFCSGETGHRQGARRARAPRRERARRAARSSRSTARRSRRPCSRASSSATCAARSPARRATAPGSSRRPTAARCSSTRSASAARRAGEAPARRSRSARCVRVGEHARARRSTCASIAATHRDLEARGRAGSFREDLSIGSCHRDRMPPLRERREDIPILVRHFLAMRGRRSALAGRAVRRRALARSSDYTWPGNVRELEHAVERVVLLGRNRGRRRSRTCRAC